MAPASVIKRYVLIPFLAITLGLVSFLIGFVSCFYSEKYSVYTLIVENEVSQLATNVHADFCGKRIETGPIAEKSFAVITHEAPCEGSYDFTVFLEKETLKSGNIGYITPGHNHVVMIVGIHGNGVVLVKKIIN